MNLVILYYFRTRIEKIQASKSVSIGETMSAENVRNADVSKEMLEALNTSFQVKAQPTLLANNNLTKTINYHLQHIIIFQEAQGKNLKFDDIMAFAIFYFNIGMAYSDVKLQESNVKTYFTLCLEVLKKKELEPKAIITVIKVLNKLHTIFYNSGQVEESWSFLDRAIELYSRYTKKKTEYPDPINFSAILGKLLLAEEDYEDPNSKIALENLQLTTLLNMIRLYQENQLYDKHKFVIYIYNILRQIMMEKVSILYISDFAVVFSNLCLYFKRSHCFVEAKNCMITAEYMIKTLFQNIVTINEEEKKSDLYTNIREAHTAGHNIVIKFWGLYGTELLIASADELLPREEKEINKSCKKDNLKSKSVMKSEENSTNLLMFPGIEEKKQLLESFTAQFPDKCVSNLKDAKTIFVNVLECFDTAKKYFTIKNHIMYFVVIKVEEFKLYNALATFDQENKLKLYLKQKEVLLSLDETLHSLPKLDLTTISKLNFFTLKKKIKVDTTILNIKTENLLLNVEQLNKAFTKNFEADITTTVNSLISLIQSSIKYFDDISES